MSVEEEVVCDPDVGGRGDILRAEDWDRHDEAMQYSFVRASDDLEGCSC